MHHSYQALDKRFLYTKTEHPYSFAILYEMLKDLMQKGK